jgi:methylamine dehydrogenase heavy chain
MNIAIGLIVSMAIAAASTAAVADVEPQHLTVKAAIAPGPNVFTLRQEWQGASTVDVFSADDLTYKGNMSGGMAAQMAVSPDGKTVYVASQYLKRIVYGTREVILQTYDVATLSPLKEIPLVPKLVNTTLYQQIVAQSADGRYIFVQNATPATSVSVVDLSAGKVAAEIPGPGCFGIFPAPQGSDFTTICGDGTFAKFTLRAKGAGADHTQSGKIFDVDKDPLFLHGVRAGKDLIFVSYHGMIYRVNDSDATPRLVETTSLVQGLSGNWAPGGYQLMAYNKASDVLFIGMHPDAKDGSHKTPATEIWAYNLGGKKLLFRSAVDAVIGFNVTDDARPIIFANNEKILLRYEVDPEAKFALHKTAQATNKANYSAEVVIRP